MTDPVKPTILLSAGGTGGHMIPALALSEDLLSRGYHVEVASDHRGQRYQHMFANMPFHVLNSGALQPGRIGKAMSLVKMGLGVLSARKLIKTIKPAVVVGFGGYPSVPAVYAAQRMGIPTIIHESNAIMGKANIWLAPNANHIALTWPLKNPLPELHGARVVMTGNPVRAEISALYNRAYPSLQVDGPLSLLIMGGSLGAKVFSDVVPEALSRLPKEQRARLQVVQQCREDDLQKVRIKYHDAGINARLSSFVEDVPKELAQTHLFIGRSGSTVTELTAAGRPAIFVPYPHHKDQQQLMNAEAIAEQGGAWVIQEKAFTPEALLARIETFLQHPESLFEAAEAARACGKPDAARRLGNLVMTLASGWKK